MGSGLGEQSSAVGSELSGEQESGALWGVGREKGNSTEANCGELDERRAPVVKGTVGSRARASSGQRVGGS